MKFRMNSKYFFDCQWESADVIVMYGTVWDSDSKCVTVPDSDSSVWDRPGSDSDVWDSAGQ